MNLTPDKILPCCIVHLICISPINVHLLPMWWRSHWYFLEANSLSHAQWSWHVRWFRARLGEDTLVFAAVFLCMYLRWQLVSDNVADSVADSVAHDRECSRNTQVKSVEQQAICLVVHKLYSCKLKYCKIGEGVSNFTSVVLLGTLLILFDG